MWPGFTPTACCDIVLTQPPQCAWSRGLCTDAVSCSAPGGGYTNSLHSLPYDTHIVKPFSPTELVARVRAALRRGVGPYRSEPREPYVLGDLTIDYAEPLVTLAGRPVQLTATEHRLVELSVKAGRVLTHDQLKLGEDASNPTYFFAEPRVGYRMAKGETSGSEETRSG